MRKRNWITAAAVSGAVCVIAGVMLIWRPFHADTGIYIEAADPIILFQGGSGEPVVMLTDKDEMFEKLRTGDKILIFHDGAMMLSYPAQLNVSFCIRLKKGDVSDVPEGVLESLEEMGWIQGGSFGQNQ